MKIDDLNTVVSLNDQRNAIICAIEACNDYLIESPKMYSGNYGCITFLNNGGKPIVDLKDCDVLIEVITDTKNTLFKKLNRVEANLAAYGVEV